jgi:hypothetical protein
MRLLKLIANGEFRLTKDLINNIPPYAILSHTWGDDDDEVTFKDLTEGFGNSRVGYRKIQFCAEQAARDGLQHFWVDTCCIDKSNNAELSEAIISMFRWYRNAAKCYVHLSDVSTNGQDPTNQSWEPIFRKSRWFTRGWTLQELIAPPLVEFFSLEGELLGDRKSLERQVHEITGIPTLALQTSDLSGFSVTTRLSWAESRETKREEDKAYSLLGIFNIHMPPLYGEGIESAFRRLREEIEKSSSPAGLKAYSLLGMFNVHMPPQYGEGIERAFRQLREEINGRSSSAEVKPPRLPATNEAGASDSQSLGPTLGISFARAVFAAVKSSVSDNDSDKRELKPSRPPVANQAAGSGTTTMRDAFFGLQTNPRIKQAPFPTKAVGRRLVDLYFGHANPQIPILHRGEFMKMFERVYEAGNARVRTPRELYILNIVFAIGSGIVVGGSGDKKENREDMETGLGEQCQPEEYHASAIVHLESFLSSPRFSDIADGLSGEMEKLQAVLLLAGFALLRPVAPGLWYITGVAVRLAVDLGLHFEDERDIDIGIEEGLDGESMVEDSDITWTQKERSARERGRREWIRESRRRLWWCTYSFDRLVSSYLGRPFGITDHVVTTQFPSLLDDKYITPAGFLEPPGGAAEPSYKHAAYHYFRLRLLQSEILQVLQYQQAEQARAGRLNQQNPFIFTTLPCPFLSKFQSFRSWQIDIDNRLWEWKSSAPTKLQLGVDFLVEFFELNYWQCIIMLYRGSLGVPPIVEGEHNTSEEEAEERVFLKVAEASQRVLRLYRILHNLNSVHYIFLDTHHLFMAGISFLYAIWHSEVVRSRLVSFL